MTDINRPTSRIRNGRVKCARVKRQHWYQLQPTAAGTNTTVTTEATTPLPITTGGRQFAATIKLTPDIFEALQRGDASALGLSLRVGAKENDIQLLMNGESFKLRCSKEEPKNCDIYQSYQYQGENNHEEEEKMDEDEDQNDGEESSTSQRRPLFAPYNNLFHPLPIALSYKYYVPTQLNEDSKQSVAKKSELAEKEFRPKKVIQTHTLESVPSTKEPFKRISPAAAAAMIGTQASATALASGSAVAPPPKRAYKKRKEAPDKAADVNGEEKKARKKKKEDEAAILSTPKATATNNHHLLSPSSTVQTPTSMASPSPSQANLSSPIASATSLALDKPKLLRSPSTAASPSPATANETLRARIVHFLAAQPLGLPMSTLRQRLGVTPEAMKSTLAVLAKYVSPGYYELKPEMYAEVQVDSWADYTLDDRRRVVSKMTRLGLEIEERIRLAYGPTVDAHVKTTNSNQAGSITSTTAGPSTSASSTAAAAHPKPHAATSVPSIGPNYAKLAADFVAPILAPLPPPLPDLNSLPDDLPPAMMVQVPPDSSSTESRVILAPPTIIHDYMQYLTMHTEFLQNHRLYKMLCVWLNFMADRTVALRSAMDSHTDSAMKSAIKKQIVLFITESRPVRQQRHQRTQTHTRTYESLRELVERKQKVLHLLLTSLKRSVQQYADEHHIYTVPSIKEEETNEEKNQQQTTTTLANRQLMEG